MMISTAMKSLTDDKFTEPLRRLKRTLDPVTALEIRTDFATRYAKEMEMPEMLMHGDLWINNLLWHNKSPDRVAAFIDWQLVHKGNLASDFAHFMVLCMDPDIRRDVEKRIFVRYLERLTKNLNSKGIQVPFSLNQLERAYRQAFIGQAVAAIVIFPFFERNYNDDCQLSGAEKIDRLHRRLLSVLEDAIEALKCEAPQWLCD